jgi:hypothetical protein
VTEPGAPTEVLAPPVSPAPDAEAQEPPASGEAAHSEPSAQPDAPAPAHGRSVTLDVLVYSESPAERLVFINGRKYVEGQRTDQGMVVEAITPQGAMMSHEGRRFLLEAAGTR